MFNVAPTEKKSTYQIILDLRKKKDIENNANVQHFFLQSIINIVIQVIFPNIITYLDRTFKEEQNGLNFKIK